MLNYDFMRIAFISAFLLGIVMPLLGSGAVYKRLSNSGDALAHSSLAGVAIGLASGLNPLYISIVSCVVAFIIIELLRKRFSKYAEIGVAIVLSAAIALVGVLSNYSQSGNFTSYLFGSIILISYQELIVTGVLAILAITFTILFYPQTFSLLYSESEAKASGIKVELLNMTHSILLALTVAIGTKIVGSLVISGMIVIPTAIAMLFKKGYRFTMIFGVIVSTISMLLGLTMSYYLDWAPGASIILLSVGILVLVLLVKGIIYLLNKGKIKRSKSSI